MSNKITFKNWLANLEKELWQAICWVGRCLSPKYKTPFWRILGDRSNYQNTYLCKYKDASAGVIVNSKGEIVQHQNL